jgi:hypothetical protein
MKTVRDVTYQLLREFGLTTIFGNAGSAEETFLKDFPYWRCRRRRSSALPTAMGRRRDAPSL